jgi:DNA-binding beta-propeller fold protein YncE
MITVPNVPIPAKSSTYISSPNASGVSSGAASSTQGQPIINESIRPEQKIKLISSFGERGEEPGQFLELSGITTSPSHLLAGDVLGRRVQAFSKTGKWLFTLKSRQETTSKKTASSATNGLFSSPAYLCVDDSGIIYATDSSDHYIRLYDRQGFFIKEIRNHPGKDGGLQGIACDQKGNIYVCDVDNNAVQVLNANLGTWIRSIGGRGGGAGQLQYPAGLTMDKKNNLYVVDYALSRISVFTNGGHPLMTIGSKGSGPGEFNVPRDVAIDRNNKVYVCDSLNHRIQVFASDGRFLYSFGGSGREPGHFLGPSSLAIDLEKHIMYVADRGNNRIQIFQLPAD